MRVAHSWTENTAEIKVEGLERRIRVLHMTDSHVFSPADEADPTYKDAATSYRNHYTEVRRDASGNGVSTEDTFAEMMERAPGFGLDLIAFTGDMVHCSSPASIRKVTESVELTGVPYISIAGNHEWWHFQDLPNLPDHAALRAAHDRDALRAAWWGADRSHNRQLPVYSTEVAGVRFVAIDDGNYQINSEQLEIVKGELALGKPVVLMMHIPLSVPTLRPPSIEVWDAPILLAEPYWRSGSRKEWEIRTNDAETLEFAHLVTASENVVAILAGHLHFSHVDSVNRQAAQYVSGPGFAGEYRLVEFAPLLED